MNNIHGWHWWTNFTSISVVGEGYSQASPACSTCETQNHCATKMTGGPHSGLWSSAAFEPVVFPSQTRALSSHPHMEIYFIENSLKSLKYYTCQIRADAYKRTYKPKCSREYEVNGIAPCMAYCQDLTDQTESNSNRQFKQN